MFILDLRGEAVERTPLSAKFLPVKWRGVHNIFSVRFCPLAFYPRIASGTPEGLLGGFSRLWDRDAGVKRRWSRQLSIRAFTWREAA